MSKYLVVPGKTEITRRIAGHRITLTAGVRYLASRPIAEKGIDIYPVFIERLQLAPSEMETYTPDVVGEFSLDEANEFINEFNNGTISFEGRVW